MSRSQPTPTTEGGTASTRVTPPADQLRAIKLAREILSSVGGVSLEAILAGINEAYEKKNWDVLASMLSCAYNVARNMDPLYAHVIAKLPPAFRIEGPRKDNTGRVISHNVNSTAIRLAGQALIMMSTHPRAIELKRQKGNTFESTHNLGSEVNMALQREAAAQYGPAWNNTSASVKRVIQQIADETFLMMESA
jgi:hypothetical protein